MVMRVGLAFAAGAVGWVVMVVLLAFLRLITVTNIILCLMLGSMLTRTTSGWTWFLGFLVGLVTSGLVALVYAEVFESIGRSNWRLGLLGGVIHAALGGIFFAVMPLANPAMPRIVMAPGLYGANYGPGGIASFLFVHLVFGAIVGGIYRPLHAPGDEAAVSPDAATTPPQTQPAHAGNE
jgi:hypothetical protein